MHLASLGYNVIHGILYVAKAPKCAHLKYYNRRAYNTGILCVQHTH